MSGFDKTKDNSTKTYETLFEITGTRFIFTLTELKLNYNPNIDDTAIKEFLMRKYEERQIDFYYSTIHIKFSPFRAVGISIKHKLDEKTELNIHFALAPFILVTFILLGFIVYVLLDTITFFIFDCLLFIVYLYIRLTSKAEVQEIVDYFTSIITELDRYFPRKVKGL